MEHLADSTIHEHLLPLLPRQALASLAPCSQRFRGLVHGRVQRLCLSGDDAAQHRCHERFPSVTRVEYALGSTVAFRLVPTTPAQFSDKL